MQVSVKNNVPILKLTVREEKTLTEAVSLLVAIAKHGDSIEADKAAADIDTVLTQFCPKEKASA